MSVLAADIAPRFRLADPKPAYCSVCIQAAQEGVDFIDANAEFDGPTFVHPQTGMTVNIQDDIYICLSCVAQMCEVANLKPELHIRQAREIRRLELAAETWQQRCEQLEKLIGRPDPVHPEAQPLMESVFEPQRGVRVFLSSGDSFYVSGSLGEAAAALDRGRGRFVVIGGRWVNPHQVCQLTAEAVPSLETPEILDTENDVA